MKTNALLLAFLLATSLLACEDTGYSGTEGDLAGENNGVDNGPSRNNDGRTNDLVKFDRALITGARGLQCGQTDSSISVGFVLLDQKGEALWPGDEVGLESARVSEVEVSVSSASLGAREPGELFRCPSACRVEADCAEQAGRFCVDGFCVRNQDTSAEEVHGFCQAVGFDRCGGVSDGDPEALLEPYPSMSFCRVACVDDDECGSDLRCIQGETGGLCAVEAPSVACVDDSECVSGTCTPVDDGFSPSSVCREPAAVELEGELSFEPVSDDSTLAIVMDNSGSLFGRGVTEEDRTVRLDRATDPDLFRIATTKALLLNLGNSLHAEKYRVGLWSFRGQGPDGVRQRTGSPGDPASAFGPVDGVRTPAFVALDDLSYDGDYGRSNVFAGLEEAALGLEAAGRQNATILLFTDGPDDSFVAADASDRGAQRTERAAALDRALDAVDVAGARVVVVHLDSGIGADGLAVSGTDFTNAAPFAVDGEGRTGPLDEYAHIACASGGDYLYATDSRMLNDLMHQVERALRGGWRLELAIPELEGAGAGPYRLSAELEFRIGERTETAVVAPFGFQSPYGLLETDDNRLIVWSRE